MRPRSRLGRGADDDDGEDDDDDDNDDDATVVAETVAVAEAGAGVVNITVIQVAGGLQGARRSLRRSAESGGCA